MTCYAWQFDNDTAAGDRKEEGAGIIRQDQEYVDGMRRRNKVSIA